MSKYLLTGATGYIGSLMVHLLVTGKDNKITALVRDREKAERVLPSGVDVLVADITNGKQIRAMAGEYDYIVHLAAVTKSQYMSSNPVETADGIVLGTRNILELAKRCQVKSVVFVSSMEVYGDVDCSDGHRATEEELGDLDILKPRSSYPMGKRMAEHYAAAYALEYGVPVKIARLAQTFGHGVPATDNRVFMQFARSVARYEDIILHTDGKSIGNYCEVDDAIDAILLLLEKGSNGEAYNVVNEENTMSIREMAELVADNFGGGISNVKIEIPKEDRGYAADTRLRLSGRKMMSLGWKPKKNMIEMYRDLINSL